MIRRLICGLALALAPLAAGAEQIAARYSVQALGVKMGELVLTGSLEARRYTASSQFRTTGLAGAVARVRFMLQASGRRDGARFSPEVYREEMNTGRRESQAQLDYSGGLARAATPGSGTVSAAAQRGAVDPLTALLMVLRDREGPERCDLRQRVFDGERLSEIRFDRRAQTGGAVICSGSYRRIAGYPAQDLQGRRDFPVEVQYTAEDGVLRARRIRVGTIYGPALLVRR